MVFKKIPYLLYVLPLLLVTCCSRAYKCYIRIANLDSEEKILNLYFKFKETKPQSIVILDSSFHIILRGYFQKPIHEFSYPKSLDSVLLQYPVTKDKMPILYKNQTYYFDFDNTDEWEYLPFYASQDGRWLFDDNGSPKDFAIKYEKWLGKDVVLTLLPYEINLQDSSLFIKDQDGNNLGFSIKSETNPCKKFAIILEKDISENQKLIFLFESENDTIIGNKRKYNKYPFQVPSTNSIGLSGKSNSIRSWNKSNRF